MSNTEAKTEAETEAETGAETQENVLALTSEEQQTAHDAEMVAKVDAAAQETEESLQTDQERMLAGKYKSVEELEKAYKHLQDKLAGKQDTPEDVEAATDGVTEDSSVEQDAAKELTESKGIDYASLEGEYADSGALSEETYKSLSDSGIPKNLVDAYIAGQEALTASAVTRMHSVVGGEAEYNSMIQWAGEALSESEQEAFNSSLTSEDASNFAIQGLFARYAAQRGPSLLRGDAGSAKQGGYASKAEMMHEMSNPKYSQDPAFRASVQRRVALSSF